MSKKVLNIVAAGLLSSMGSIANATLLTPVYDSNWQTFSYDTTGYIGGSLLIGVSDIKGFTGGNSVLNLKNLVGLDLVDIADSAGSVSVGTDSVMLQTLNDDAGGDCSYYVTSNPLGGDCSYIKLEITEALVELKWLMQQGGDVQQVGDVDSANDFAFYALAKSDGNGARDGYLTPSSSTAPTRNVPEPSTVALMAVGLLGASMAARRKRI